MDVNGKSFRLVNSCVAMHNPLDNLRKHHIYLASKSPRRRQLLAMLDIDFDIAPVVEVDESYPPYLVADKAACHIATKKAEAYSQLIIDEPDALVITADTIVVCDDVILGKPADYDEAHAMLRKLSGKKHKVVTGVAITSARHRDIFSDTTTVAFRDLDDNEIRYYVEHYSPLDKAGAYGIQEWIGAAAVDEMRGSFYNVMGLPVEMLYKRLRLVK